MIVFAASFAMGSFARGGLYCVHQVGQTKANGSISRPVSIFAQCNHTLGRCLLIRPVLTPPAAHLMHTHQIDRVVFVHAGYQSQVGLQATRIF
jgi:hypothetical protein